MRIGTIILALGIAMAAEAQEASVDTTAQGVRIGYFRTDWKTLSGAIDKVDEVRMNKGLVISSLDALSGQAAGVTVATGGNQEAMVSAVRVRGTTSLTGGNDPLVIIDGVTADLATLSTIYPSDIESFTILKDASETAQYGSRGAAGVIEVATKKGKSQKFQISYDGNFGFEQVYKRLEMTDAAGFRQAAQQRGVSYIDKGYDTDFNKAIERTGFVQSHHIAFGGGTETANYRASVAMTDHQTVIKTQGYRNFIAKLDISQQAFDNHLAVDLGMVGSIQKVDYLPSQQQLLYSAATFIPTLSDKRNPDGTYDQVTEALWISNPMSLLDKKQNEDNSHFNIHLKAKVTLAKDFYLRAFGSYSFNNVGNNHYYPTTVWNRGEAFRGHEKNEEILANISLSYQFNVGKSAFNVMALAEETTNKIQEFHTTVTGFTSDAYGYEELTAGSARPWDGTDSYYTESHMQSVLLRAQYTFNEKYTLTVNARGDASSKFGKNHRWGFFPSASGAWIISKEKWMKPLTFISNAKLRAGYGLSGNQAGIDSYNSMELIQPNGVVPVGGAPVVTLGIIRNANPDLKWEIKRTFNVGLDLASKSDISAVCLFFPKFKVARFLFVVPEGWRISAPCVAAVWK